jgi:hypothetical protein
VRLALTGAARGTSEASGRALFAAVLVTGLAWRALLAFVVVPHWEGRAGVAPTPDAYPLLAISLVERGVLGYAPDGASPTTVRGPGFPAWLAASVAIGLDDTRWLALWGGVPGVLAGAWLAGWVGRRLGLLGGIVAGAVAVLHPLPSLIASRAMGDDFYGAVGLAGLATWIAALEAKDRRRGLALAAIAGGLLALQMLARASGVLTLLVALACSLRALRGRVALGGMLLLVALVPPLAWSARSSALAGSPVFVHSLGAYNFWIGEGFDRFGAGPPPAGHYDRIVRFALEHAGSDFEQERFWYARLEPPRAAELDRRLARAARARVAGDPLGYALRVLRGLPAFWFGAQTEDRTRHYTLAVVPVLLLAAFGVRRAFGDPLGRLLLCTLLAHNLAYAAVLPMARLSVQVYAPLAYLAAQGVRSSLHSLRRGNPHSMNEVKT